MERDLDLYSQQYANQAFEPVMVHFRQQKTLTLLGDTTGKHILEIGCGLAPCFHWIPDYASVDIIEPATEFYDYAERLRSEHRHRESIFLHACTAENYKNIDNKVFDYIIINSLLHELAEPKQLLQQVRFLCAAHTQVCINVPNAHSLHRMLAVHMGLIASPDTLSEANRKFHQHQVFTARSLEALVVSAEFRILHTETAFIKPFTHRQMQDALDSGLFSAPLLQGLMDISVALPAYGADIYMMIQV